MQLCAAYHISHQIAVPDSKGVRSFSSRDTQWGTYFSSCNGVSGDIWVTWSHMLISLSASINLSKYQGQYICFTKATTL